MRLRAAVLLLTAAALLSAPSGHAQADRAVPFRAGEVLTFDVSWTNYLTAGSASLSVKERRSVGTRAAYYLVAEGKPASVLAKLYHLYYKAESLLDTRTLQPALATLYSNERGRTRLKTTTFLGNGTASYELKTASLVRSTITIPATAQDPLGALYVLRALPLTSGQTFTIPVTDGGKVFSVRVTVGARELVKSVVGTVSAHRITLGVRDVQGKPTTARVLTLWLSDDARRLPLKFEAGLAVGSFVLTLAHVAG